MSLPARPPHRIPLSEKALAAQALEVERLRHQVAAAQAEGGKMDPALVAQFAQVQRAFLEAKIQIEQMRKAGILIEEPETTPELAAEMPPVVEPPVAPEPVVEVATSPAVEEPSVVEASPATQKGRPLLTASRVFWLLVIFLLTALLWFMRSPFANQ